MAKSSLAWSDLSAALRVSPHNEDVLAALKGVRGQLDASASASICEELQRMQSLRELREMCEGKGLDCSSCVDKRDMIDLLASSPSAGAAGSSRGTGRDEQVGSGRQVDKEQLRRSLRAKMGLAGLRQMRTRWARS